MGSPVFLPAPGSFRMVSASRSSLLHPAWILFLAVSVWAQSGPSSLDTTSPAPSIDTAAGLLLPDSLSRPLPADSAADLSRSATPAPELYPPAIDTAAAGGPAAPTSDSAVASPSPTASIRPASKRAADSLRLNATVTVMGKSQARARKDGPLEVGVVDLKALRGESTDLIEAVNRAPGIKVRQSGGRGSETEVNINGLQGKAIRFFKDGVPLDYLGPAFTLENIPVSGLDRVEIYKGVLPASLGADALGGAVNLVSRSDGRNELEISQEVGYPLEQEAFLHANHVSEGGVLVGLGGAFTYARNDYPFMAFGALPSKGASAAGDIETEFETRRFHDALRRMQIEGRTGLIGHALADELRVSLNAVRLDKEVQHSPNGETVYGEVRTWTEGYIPSMRYRKNFSGPQIHLDLFGAFSHFDRRLIDTSSRSYYWNGEIKPDDGRSGEIEPGRKSLISLENDYGTSRSQIGWRPLPGHLLSLNHTWTGHWQKGAQAFFRPDTARRVHPLSIPGIYHRHYAGLGLESRIFGEIVTNEIAVKGFLMRAEGAADYWSGGFAKGGDEFYGFSEALKYRFSPNLFIRGSYERAVRLPDNEELLGDGFFVMSNLSLLPEKSHNWNVGAGWKNGSTGSGALSVDLHLFLRFQENLIYFERTAFIYSQYLNRGKTDSKGLEAATQYRPFHFLDLELNATYQELRKRSPQSLSEEFHLDARLPNIPFLFGNFGGRLRFTDLLFSSDLFSPTYNLRYIHTFYLKAFQVSQEPRFFWQTPAENTDEIIPAQWVHDAGAVYSFGKPRVSLSVDVKNFLDHRVYDHFRLQQPGRSYHAKLLFHL